MATLRVPEKFGRAIHRLSVSDKAWLLDCLVYRLEGQDVKSDTAVGDLADLIWGESELMRAKADGKKQKQDTEAVPPMVQQSSTYGYTITAPMVKDTTHLGGTRDEGGGEHYSIVEDSIVYDSIVEERKEKEIIVKESIVAKATEKEKEITEELQEKQENFNRDLIFLISQIARADMIPDDPKLERFEAGFGNCKDEEEKAYAQERIEYLGEILELIKKIQRVVCKDNNIVVEDSVLLRIRDTKKKLERDIGAYKSRLEGTVEDFNFSKDNLTDVGL